MSILQRQLRVCLAAFVAAGLFLAGVTIGHAAAAPCDGDHDGAVSAQLVELEPADTKLVIRVGHDLAQCCSTVATSCCASAAIIQDDTTEPSHPLVHPAWLATVPVVLHGLGDEVSRRPPRFA